MTEEKDDATPKLDWSPQQQEAIRKVEDWIKAKAPQVFRLFGYAGTGKTTLAKHLASGVKGKVCYASLTGKAAQVLRNKGCTGASTIHSLIYRVHVDPVSGTPSFSLNHESALVGAKLLIVDEVSMVDEETAKDLLSFKVPILVLGDPAQLPPVKGTGFFIDAAPDMMLTEVHRQAAENPIIQASMNIRNGERLSASKNEHGTVSIVPRRGNSISIQELMSSHDQTLCGLNKTRMYLNQQAREALNRKSPYPEVGDRLVCLRNDHNIGIYNGSLWDVLKTTKDGNKCLLQIKSADEERSPVDVVVREEFFLGTEKNIFWRELRNTQQFTYGYALTVHKSQGSQWDDVLLVDESFVFQEDRQKHLYTAVTRAAVNLTVVL